MRKITFDRTFLSDFGRANQAEWLETNGLGGYASSTLAGVHTRRYHGLFVAAVKPPTKREVLVSRLDEKVICAGSEYELGCVQYPGTVHPQGFKYMNSFSRDLFPTWEYQIGDVVIRKTIAAIQGENTVVVLYEARKATGAFVLRLTPLLAARDYHSLTQCNDHISREAQFSKGSLYVVPYAGGVGVSIYVPGSEFQPQPDWYHSIEYLGELDRGFDFKEDLFCYGTFEVKLRKGAKLGVVLSTAENESRDAWELFAQETKRREALLNLSLVQDELGQVLTLASDQFIVSREGNSKSIIAGYPWFTDWGRDTMIALPGLCLVTGRHEDAKAILLSFKQFIRDGLIPNRFPDHGEEPEYNTVDASLWYFVAVYQYLKASADSSFVRKELYPALCEMIEWHLKGTQHHIRVDEDGLLAAGDPYTQLTWMDAKIGNYAVTPRYGKAVEINALWYNALKICAELSREFGTQAQERSYNARAETVKQQFLKTFWFEEGGYLCDYVNGNEADGYQRDTTLRPNQIFALSLPFALVGEKEARSILAVVSEKLLTPRGLRTLPPGHSAYRARYEGDSWSRDTAYHQGTVWPWLLGAVVSAELRFHGEEGRRVTQQILSQMTDHLYEAGVGSVSEIFDAESPHTPRGCPFQAWSVAEFLRTYHEFLTSKPSVQTIERSSSEALEARA